MSHEIGGPVNDASHELVEIPSSHRNVHPSTSDPQETQGTPQCTSKAAHAPCACALHNKTADAELVRVAARLAPPSQPWWRSADGPSTARQGLASWQLDAIKHI